MLTTPQVKTTRLRASARLNRAQTKQSRALKKAAIDKDLSITQIAEKIGHSRSVTSRAINRLEFPRVLRKVKEVLGA